ncbi:putative phosphothreonine lyase domain-containing protein [Streptomyces violascens]|uniref:putative phosphothreonine lyase domain-containing protein n=1 Tax=Streptomyces violascens TaxID=67381 RepID=UPI00364ECE36
MDTEMALTDQLAPRGHDSPSRELTEPWFWALAPKAPEFPADDTWTGKWLWFPPLSLLDRSWATVRAGVDAGLLDYGAKTATLVTNRAAAPSSDDTRRPICIYTRDWRDTEDVRRVLAALRNMGIKETLHYKSDTATREGRYGEGTSTYISPAGSTTLAIPRRTREALEHFHAARAQARAAADARRTGRQRPTRRRDNR